MNQQGRHRAVRSRTQVPLAAAIVGLLCMGVWFAVRAADSPRTAASSAEQTSSSAPAPVTPVPKPVPKPVPMPAPTPGITQLPSSASAAAAVSPPVRLTVASIGVDTSLQSLALLSDGTLQPPSSWDVAGWYAGGIKPGQIGPAVIAGHIDSTKGPAVFYRLNKLTPGAQATVTDLDGTVLTFVVDDVQSFPKNGFPAGAIYGPTPYPELRLITCTGDFDFATHNYLSNLVVSAHLVTGGTT